MEKRKPLATRASFVCVCVCLNGFNKSAFITVWQHFGFSLFLFFVDF